MSYEEDYEIVKNELGFYIKEYVTKEENKKYSKSTEFHPTDVYLDEGKSKKEIRYYRKMPIDVSENDINQALAIKQYIYNKKILENLNIIKNSVLFFVVLTVIGFMLTLYLLQ